VKCPTPASISYRGRFLLSGHYALRSKGLGFPLFETLAFSQKKNKGKKRIKIVVLCNGLSEHTKKRHFDRFFSYYETRPLRRDAIPSASFLICYSRACARV
jgi:hypothetical protein